MSSKLQVLLEQEKNIFTSSDLAVLWEIENKNTLLKTLSRYESKGYLHRIYKGLYSVKPLENLHPYELGCAIAGPSGYVSAETILAKEGLIFQELNSITLYGARAKQLEVAGNLYLVRYLNPIFLLNRLGITYINNYYLATTLRAVADILYTSPNYYIDRNEAIDQKELSEMQHKLNYT